MKNPYKKIRRNNFGVKTKTKVKPPKKGKGASYNRGKNKTITE